MLKYLIDNGERRAISVNREGKAGTQHRAAGEALARFQSRRGGIEDWAYPPIRVHLSHAGFPLCGDDKYGDFALNKQLEKEGLKRMFLHAAKLPSAIRSRTRRSASRPCRLNWKILSSQSSRARRGNMVKDVARRFELIVFDWDGTLMDSAAAAIVQAIRRPVPIWDCRFRPMRAPVM